MAALTLLICSQSLAATTKVVDISYKHPESFSDASLNANGYERGADDYVMNSLSSYMERLGARYLKPGQQLQIEVDDIDLAGRYEPWRPNASQVRFMRDITWPIINPHYVLKQDGRVLSQDDARVMDQLYLQRPGRAGSNDRLYAEKAMLDDWFRTKFAHPQ
nr:DUF3016 domain-containing protein [Pseudomonas akapageensis]